MSFRFTTRVPVRWNDIDSFGVLNNAIYFTLLEQARFEYFAHLELLRNSDFPFLLGATSCKFLTPGRLGMEIDIGVRTERLGTKSLDTLYQFTHSNETIATASATLIWVDENLRTIPIPDSARQSIQEFEEI